MRNNPSLTGFAPGLALRTVVSVSGIAACVRVRFIPWSYPGAKRNYPKSYPTSSWTYPESYRSFSPDALGPCYPAMDKRQQKTRT